MGREREQAIERFAEQLGALVGTEIDPNYIEAAAESALVAIVDTWTGEGDELDAALTRWLAYTRAPSGAFGQSMEATMAFAATRDLRAAAARHLKAQREVSS